MPRRILIMGAAGSGKSTLAAALAARLGYRWSDTDDFYWLHTATPFDRKRDRDEQFRLLTEALSQPGGQIVSGSFSGWGSRILPFADAMVWVVAPTNLRLERIRLRQHERSEMPSSSAAQCMRRTSISSARQRRTTRDPRAVDLSLGTQPGSSICAARRSGSMGLSRSIISSRQSARGSPWRTVTEVLAPSL